MCAGEALSGEQGGEPAGLAPGADADAAAAAVAAARGGGRHSEAPVAQQLHTYERQVVHGAGRVRVRVS